MSRPHSPVPPEPAADLAPAAPQVCGPSLGTGRTPSSRSSASGTSSRVRLRAWSLPSGSRRRTRRAVRRPTARPQR